METIFENTRPGKPRVSFILLDWSCRESFHTIEYLNSQTVARRDFEIIWIEYYGRRPARMRSLLESFDKENRPPALDKWIAVSMPEDVCYHKHLMYNLGVIAARSPIVCFCDSDAVVAPTFVESILEAFEKEKDIVLHIDEIRNASKRFYPFNNPSIEEIKGRGCVNWTGKTTKGLAKRHDPVHTLNYGACMCALKEDLVSIGGADEHIDYLGHICGPYEMTFRLVNAGKKEVWHPKEFLYHVWHPGTDGKNNYMGPHDGLNVSLAALEAKRAGRVLPLLENPAIRALRLK
ncbi:MAG: glycosyltransferase, partial [Deltaproteobacteria bacterium]|nr:glycosyltransferase [Deltaproteobacteria bacterium]